MFTVAYKRFSYARLLWEEIKVEDVRMIDYERIAADERPGEVLNTYVTTIGKLKLVLQDDSTYETQPVRDVMVERMRRIELPTRSSESSPSQ